MSHCRRCNRILKREPWRTKGIGKICEGKERIAAEKNDADSDIQVPYDGGDIWVERIAAPTLIGNGAATMNLTHTASGIKTNVPRIIYRHSPTGFNFGYGGSGPADLALNICAMFCHKPEHANSIYQDFKWKFLGEQGDKLIIPKADIISYLLENNIPVKSQYLTA